MNFPLIVERGLVVSKMLLTGRGSSGLMLLTVPCWHQSIIISRSLYYFESMIFPITGIMISQ